MNRVARANIDAGLCRRVLWSFDNSYHPGGIRPNGNSSDREQENLKWLVLCLLDELATKLASKRFAAFIVEPVQVEAGMRIPDTEYLKQVQALCRRYGTLFVLDEVQTGFHRTGPFLAAHFFGVDPDIIILAKALSGGLVPVGAVLMTDAVYNSTYSSFKRSIVHTSTYNENALAMRAGLVMLEVRSSSVRSNRWSS